MDGKRCAEVVRWIQLFFADVTQVCYVILSSVSPPKVGAKFGGRYASLEFRTPSGGCPMPQVPALSKLDQSTQVMGKIWLSKIYSVQEIGAPPGPRRPNTGGEGGFL